MINRNPVIRAEPLIEAEKILVQFSVLCELTLYCEPAELQMRQLTELEMTLRVLGRQISKTLYHARQFVSIATKFLGAQLARIVEANDSIGESAASFGTLAPDSVYFEFDAFVLAARGILEKNIYKRINANMGQPRTAAFQKAATAVRTRLLSPLLKLIRDEISHLNNFGTSIGSVANFAYAAGVWSVRFPCEYSIDAKRSELGYIVEYILENLCVFLRALVPLLRDELYESFGPAPPLAVHVGSWVVSLPSLEVNAVHREVENDPNRF